ncbi:MAG TPA: CsgG/HfaB family protein [Gammaproteobacteria bacterium]|nr:CsgG/HfaB family protein [Gammaproteobacteria bacterium]
MRLKTLSTALAGVAFAAGVAAAQSKPTVAVLYFTNSALGARNADLQPLSKGIADMLISSLAANPNIRVVERDRIQAVLDEQKLSTDGKLDQETAVKVGKIVGAHHMITGVFASELKGDSLHLRVRVFNVETSEIENGGIEVAGKMDALLPLIDKLGDRLNRDLKLPSIPAPAREEHNASMKKQEKVPFQAVMLYSRALDEKDHGNKDKAITLFNQAIAAFPQYEAPKAELKKLQG